MNGRTESRRPGTGAGEGDVSVPQTPLQRLQAAAEAQLQAARTLDLDGLQEATARRQEAFEAMREAPPTTRAELEAAAGALAPVDERLTRLLLATLRGADRVTNPPPVISYDAGGKLRRSAR